MNQKRPKESKNGLTPLLGRARVRTRVLVVGLILAVAIVGGIPYAVASRDARRPPIQELPITVDLPAGSSLESLASATVIEITSGSTLRVRLDGKDVAIRYLGVSTPARGRKCYREALDRNELLVGEELFRSHKVLVLREPDGSYDEDALYVFNEDGVSINATLIAEGFASASSDLGLYSSLLGQLEEEARLANRGCLWSEAP